MEEELEEGRYRQQAKALALCRRQAYLPITEDIRRFAAQLLDDQVVPRVKAADALQLATACVHQGDYLVTWNQSYLASSEAQRQAHARAKESGFRAPFLVTPVTIPKRCLSQEIRRHD